MDNRNSGATILVADDDLEARNYFETLLSLQGYEVVLAESGGHWRIWRRRNARRWFCWTL